MDKGARGSEEAGGILLPRLTALQSVLDAVSDALFVHDGQGNILYVNQRTLQMYGVSLPEALEMSILEDYSAPDAPTHRLSRLWREVLAGEEKLFEWKARRPDDGSVFDVEVHLTPFEADERPLVLAAVRDISDRKDLERDLLETRERIKKLHDFVLRLENVSDEQQAYQLAVEASENILDLMRSAIVTAELNVLIPQATSSGVPEGGVQPCLVHEGQVGRAYRTGKTQVTEDAQTDEVADPASTDYRAMMSVPVGDFGVFQCTSDRRGAYDAETIEAIEIFCSHIAAAVERIRSQRRLQRQRKEAEQLAAEYEVIFQGTQDGMFLLSVDPDDGFCVQKTNSALRDMGISFVGQARACDDEAARSEVWSEMSEHLMRCRDQKQAVSFTAGRDGSAGGRRHFLIRLSPIITKGKTVQIVGSVRERTAEMKAQKALLESEMKYRTLAENANDIIAIVQDGRHVYINRAVSDVLGYEHDEVLHSDWLEFVHPDDRGRVEQLARMRRRGETVPDVYEIAFIDRSGSKVHMEVSVSRITLDGRPATLTIARDISRRKQAERRLRYLSFHDQLTGLHNRAFFEEELNRLDVPRQLPLSVVMVDVNGLKVVNDAFGHQEGDRLLVDVGKIMRGCCRQEDIVARIGGDEFAVIFPQTPAETAEEIAARIRTSCSRQDREPLQLPLSLGWATKEKVDEDVWGVLSRAEERMYRDKMLRQDSVRGAIIQSLTNALEEKTQETTRHTERLERLAAAVGRKLKLRESEINNLALLAQLHDIGKVAVPDRILLKQEPLTEVEQQKIKRHPEIGYRIARTTVELAPIAEAILSHHEWFNGRGYPRGIEGEEIPLLARILAVVDAYDAMTHDRPYREALDHCEASEELQRQAGSQFDPQAVRALLEVLSEEGPPDGS